MNGSTSGFVELDCQATGGNNNIKLPSSNGSANQFLKNGSTAGTLGWSSLVEDSLGNVNVDSGTFYVDATNNRVAINTTAPQQALHVLTAGGGTNGAIQLGGSTFYGIIEHDAAITGANIYTVASLSGGGHIFKRGSTEQMRISNSGWTYTYSTGGSALSFASSRAAGTSDYLLIGTSAATGIDTGTTRFLVYTNGNVQNTNNSYAGISDIKLKENIVDATSQWEDLKALQVRKYNFKEETGQQTHTQIGLIAQEVELVSPGLVIESPDRDENDNDLGTVTKSVNYSVLYMKAVKALQEAMDRIETLEASNAALETRLNALEAQS
jgi:hypothetical protein